MDLENVLNGAKNLTRNIRKNVVPYALSLGIALSSVGCAGLNPSVEQIRANKPKPLAETIKYASKYEESVIRDMTWGYERDYYAAVWNLFNRWYPEDLKTRALSSLDSLSVLTHKPVIDSLINVYALPLDKQPDEPGNQFLKNDLAGIVNWCNSNFVTHPGALHLVQYFDDVGLLAIGNGVPQKVGNRGEQEKAITTSSIRYNGPMVDTWRIIWNDLDGENIFQDDGYGYWKWVSNSIAQKSAESQSVQGMRNPDFQKMLAALPFFEGIKNIEIIDGVSVANQDKELNPNSIDPYVVAVFDPNSLEEQCAVINLGINFNNFMNDTVAYLQGTYNLSVLGRDEIFEKDTVKFKMVNGLGEGARDNISKQVYPLQIISRNFPREISEKGLTRAVLGLDIENANGQHYKQWTPFLINKSNSDFNLLPGWFVRGSEYSHPDFIENRPFISYENFSPGDSLECLFQIPKIEGENIHMRFRFDRKEDLKTKITVGSPESVPPGWNPNIPERVAYEIPLKEGEIIRNISPSSSTFNLVKIPVPKLKEGVYYVLADCYKTDGATISSLGTVKFPEVTISKKKLD